MIIAAVSLTAFAVLRRTRQVMLLPFGSKGDGFQSYKVQLMAFGSLVVSSETLKYLAFS